MSNYATLHVKDALARLPGVGDVQLFGARDYAMRIWLDPDKVAAHSLNASEVLSALRPVTFRYKREIDPARTSQFGLVAEDVEKLNPELVVRDEEGKPYSVRYDQVNAMLLNEFLKEHRKNEEQGATIACLQKQVDTLTAGLQKVNAKLEVSRPGAQTILNNQ